MEDTNVQNHSIENYSIENQSMENLENENLLNGNVFDGNLLDRNQPLLNIKESMTELVNTDNQVHGEGEKNQKCFFDFCTYLQEQEKEFSDFKNRVSNSLDGTSFDIKDNEAWELSNSRA